jgi:hypothetical protein
MRPAHFPEFVQIKAPAGFASAVATAARSEFCSMSEYIRRRVIQRLNEAGVAIDGRSAREPERTCGDHLA